jgi:protein-S-isoprenylcysteine O-methyltransferase Ste14
MLMRQGPYGWSRNPQYLAFVAIYVGAALVTNTWWPIALLPAVVLAVSGGVNLAEEQYKRAAFGAEYDENCRRVSRWL